MKYKLAWAVGSAGAAAALGLVPLAGLYNSMESDRAALTITNVRFEPFPLVANQRELIVITVKNTGRNYATIAADGMATDRVRNRLPDNPIYEPARVTPASIGGGEELQFLSDLGDHLLTFTQSEINSLNTNLFKFIGFIKYTDQKYPYLLGGGVVRFCYVWDPTLTAVEKFGTCSEKQYTERYEYRFRDGLNIREIPLLTVGTQAVTSTTVPLRFPDRNIQSNKLGYDQKNNAMNVWFFF